MIKKLLLVCLCLFLLVLPINGYTIVQDSFTSNCFLSEGTYYCHYGDTIDYYLRDNDEGGCGAPASYTDSSNNSLLSPSSPVYATTSLAHYVFTYQGKDSDTGSGIIKWRQYTYGDPCDWNYGYQTSVAFNTTPAGSAPVASFSGNLLEGMAPLSVIFNDSSSNTPTSWYWEIGDYTHNFTTRNTSYTFTIMGNYDIKLKVTNAAGSDWENKTSYIKVNPVTFGINMYNLYDAVTKEDLTNSVTVTEYLEGYFYNDSPPFVPPPIKNFTYHTPNALYPRPSLWRTRSASDLYGFIMFEKEGYYPVISNPLGWASSQSYPMYKINLTPLVTECSKRFAQTLPTYKKELYVELEDTVTHVKDNFTTTNGIFIHNNNTLNLYIYTAVVAESGEFVGSGFIDCNNTDMLGNHINSTPLYNGTIMGNDTPEPLPERNIYVDAFDVNTGNNIYPYNVTLTDDLGYTYNWDVYANLGKLNGHASISADRIINVTTKADNYINGNKYVILSGYPLDYNGDIVIKIPMVKSSELTDYTIWNIHVYDADTLFPLPNATVTLWQSINIKGQYFTNNAGYVVLNISNSTDSYDVSAFKEYYEGNTALNQLPYGASYSTEIPLSKSLIIPTITITTQPTINPTTTPAWLPNTSVCRSEIDINNESFISPFLNIEACLGIYTPLYQKIILATLIIVMCGIILGKSRGTIIGFLTGLVIGNTICVFLQLYNWDIWVIIIIPIAAVFLMIKEISGGKKS